MIVARRAPIYYQNVVMAQTGGEEGKSAYYSAGNVNLPVNKVLGENLYGNLESMLRDGRIKVCSFLRPCRLQMADLLPCTQPNHYEVLPGGLAAVADGLTRIVSGKAAGVKLIVHPQETI